MRDEHADPVEHMATLPTGSSPADGRSGADLGAGDGAIRPAAEAAHVARCVYEAVARVSGGSAEPVKAQAAFAEAARKLGWVRPFPQLARKPDDAGQEHSVWLDEDGLRVWKATHAGMFGIVAGQARRSTPLDYLERLILCNEVFGFPWLFEGVWEDPFGRVRIVTTQPVIEGVPARDADQVSRGDIERFFEQLGFVRHEAGQRFIWVNDTIGVVAEDAYPDTSCSMTTAS
ncbi:MAG: hypothetical protein JNG86_02345 [Verrucomicrobiaceae bacterium]|nr:hypothetical protein [Verrucomicrobiaceae bacterium]